MARPDVGTLQQADQPRSAATVGALASSAFDRAEPEQGCSWPLEDLKAAVVEDGAEFSQVLPWLLGPVGTRLF
jgi:hypothetical protein